MFCTFFFPFFSSFKVWNKYFSDVENGRLNNDEIASYFFSQLEKSNLHEMKKSQQKENHKNA